MPIHFACPHCSQPLRARDDRALRRLKCPKCRRALEVPAESQPRKPLPAGSDAAMAAAEDPLSELVVQDDESVSEADEAAPRSAVQKSGVVYGAQRVAVPRWLIYAQGGLLALVAVAALAGGIWIGRSLRQETASKEVPQRPVQKEVPQHPVQIDGKLTWRAASGEIPDKDAVVIVLPDGRLPKAKIPAADLVPTRPAPGEGHRAIQAIKDLGGQYVRTGEGGRFSLHLVPGAYRVLLVSRNAQRPPGVNPRPEDVAEAGRYFAPPDAVFGPQKYRLSVMELREGSEIKYDFGAHGKP